MEQILHSWDLSIEEAKNLQVKLSKLLDLNLPSDLNIDNICYIAGVDSTFSFDGKTIISSAVIWNVRKKIVEEAVYAIGNVSFPYISGLLSFREAPTTINALKKLGIRPQVVLIDGQGIAHPRGLGLASHIGLWLQIPTIGVAKKLLCGNVKENHEKLVAKESEIIYNNKVVGVALYTKQNTLPIYISPGNLIDLESAVNVVKLCLSGYKLPEPTRLAHNYLQKIKQLNKA